MAICIKHRKTLQEVVKDVEACEECLTEAADKCLENFGSYTPELEDENDE